MALQFKFEKSEKYVIIRTTGLGKELKDFQEYAQAAVDYGEREGCRRFLLDETGLAHETSISDSFDLAEWLLQKMMANRVDKVACVGTPADYERNKDFSLFARNRGLNYRVFDSFNEAIDWLERDLNP